MSLGTRAKARADKTIGKDGVDLVVTRNDNTTRTVRFLPHPLTRDQVAQLIIEGMLNVGSEDPYRFTCRGDADVRQAVDAIAKGDRTYRVHFVVPLEISGVVYMQHAYAARES